MAKATKTPAAPPLPPKPEAPKPPTPLETVQGNPAPGVPVTELPATIYAAYVEACDESDREGLPPWGELREVTQANFAASVAHVHDGGEPRSTFEEFVQAFVENVKIEK